MLTPAGSRESSRTPRATGPHRGGSRSPPAASQSRSYIVGGRRTTCSCVVPSTLPPLRTLWPWNSSSCWSSSAGSTAVAVAAGKSGKRRELARAEAEVEPVKRLAEEDVTALGVELQDLDIDLAGEELDPGANADYQRALDAYESAKTAAAALTRARRRPARHRDPRGRSLRHGVRARPRGRASRSRSAGRRASSTRGTACRSPTSRGRRPAARRATSRPARSTSSGCAPAPSPTSAR